MRRRALIEPKLTVGDGAVLEDENDRQFITALARGLEVLRCFGPEEGPLPNQEIARRSGLPRPTVSRIMHTLRELGYLRYYPAQRSYALGGAAYVLGEVATGNFDPMGAAKPIMQRYAQATGTNVGLSTYQRSEMTYLAACEGAHLIGLQLRAGDKISLTQSVIGLTFLAAVDEGERSVILRQLKRDGLGEPEEIEAQVADARRQIDEVGFALSLGTWRPEIHGVALPIMVPRLDRIYVLSAGGPAESLPEERMRHEVGPMLRQAAEELGEALGAGRSLA